MGTQQSGTYLSRRWNETVTLAWGRSRRGLAAVRFPPPTRRRVKARKPFWITSKYGLRRVGPVNMSFKAGMWVYCQFVHRWLNQGTGPRPYDK
jgi:hypothetical protein